MQTHREAASVSAPMHPLHVQHGSEQTDVVVDSTERLHAFEQLERRQAETHNTWFETQCEVCVCQTKSN